MKKDGIVILSEYIDSLRKLSNEELGQLMMAVLDNAAGEEPNLDDASLTVEILYPIFQASIDRIRETSEQKAEAGRQGGRPKKQCFFEEKTSAFENEKAEVLKNEKPKPNQTIPNHTNISPNGDKEKAPTGPKEKQPRFSPPAVTDVAEYAKETGIRIDAERFVDFYASKGWKVGSSPMKDWKAAARNWAARDKREKPPNTPPPSGGVYSPLDGVDYSKLLKVGG